MEMVLIGMVAVCCMLAMSNWRHAMYLGVVIDVLRDPIRKVTPYEPAWMTQAMVPVWLAILVGCLAQQPSVIRRIKKIFPGVKSGTVLLFLSLTPGALMSLLLYQNGWFLAGIGGLSYAGPLAGLFIGACLASSIQGVSRFLRVFVVVNTIAMIGTPAEYFHLDWSGLGGMQGFEWIRHIPGVQVRMISGFFRSPDIAGFHAANVLIFCFILAIPKFRGDVIRPGWLIPALYATYVMFLAGRRKMFVIPILFVLIFWGFSSLKKRKNAGKSVHFLGVLLLVVAAAIVYGLWSQSEHDDYTEYYATIVTDAVPKFYDSAFGSSVETVRQSGIMGSGLGVASQGAQYAGVDRSRVWQEDGASRLFKELGVIGVLIFFAALLALIGEFRKAIRRPATDPVRSFFQFAGIAVFAGNAGSFMISHQHISGDAANGLLALLFLGGVLGHAINDQDVVPALPVSAGFQNRLPQLPKVNSSRSDSEP